MTRRAIVITREEPYFTPDYVKPIFDSSAVEIVCVYVDKRPSPHLSKLEIAQLCGPKGLIKLGALIILSCVPKGLSLAGINGERSISRLARQRGIPVNTITTIDEKIVTDIQTRAPDLLISVANSHIVPARLLDNDGLLALNSHASLLPAYRGILTAFWSLLDGIGSGGVTIHKMEKAVDDGTIFAQQEFAISNDETIFSYYRKAARIGGQLWAEVLLNLDDENTLMNTSSNVSDISGAGQKVHQKPTQFDINQFRAKKCQFI